MSERELGTGAWSRIGSSDAHSEAASAEVRAAVESELGRQPPSDAGVRGLMLDLIRHAREGSLPDPDPEVCAIVSLLLDEISRWLGEYDPSEPAAPG